MFALFQLRPNKAKLTFFSSSFDSTHIRYILFFIVDYKAGVEGNMLKKQTTKLRLIRGACAVKRAFTFRQQRMFISIFTAIANNY